MLNILMLGGLVPWHPHAGGGQIIAYKLAEALAKLGQEISYVAIAPDELQREIEWGNALYLNETSPYLQYLKTKVDFKKYDIIHAHCGEGFVYGIHRRLFRNTKFVMGYYAPRAHKFPLLRSHGEFYDFLACHSADLILSLSQYSRENISSAYFIPKSRIKVMYGGIDDSFFCKAKQQHKEKSENFTLLFCGRLDGPHEQKGVDTLLKAISLILKDHPVTLEMIGTGPRAGEYLSLARRLGIDSRVRFLGFVEHAKLPAYYAKADLFLLPTRRESFGLTFAEAMASGLPIVSTNVTAVPEVVADGETGILVPPDDPQKLATAVNSLLSNPQMMKEMGEKGRERARKYFTWEKVAQRVLKYYEAIL